MHFKRTSHSVKRYRWVVYCSLAVIYFFVYFHRLSLGVVKEELTSAFSMSSIVFANMGAMYFYAYMIMQIPAGILADTLGPRKTVTAGCLVTSAGTLMFAAAHSVPAALAGRFLVGVGVSVTYICILKVNTRWFSENEFATMSGLTGFIGNLGGIAAQAPLALMVSWFTWRYTFALIASFTFFMGLICFALVRDDPRDMGLPSVYTGMKTGDARSSDIINGLSSVIRNHRTWIIFTILACYAGTYLSFAGVWGVTYIKSVYGMTNIEASGYITYLVTGAAVGYLVTGYISDRIKSRKIPLVTFGLLTNIIWFILLYYNGGYLSRVLLKSIMALLGIFTTCFSVSWALAKEVNDPLYPGIAMSVINAGAFVGGALIPVLAGYILDSSAGALSGIDLYRRGLTPFLLINGLALVLSFFIKETGCRNIYR